ncbi:MAG: leucine-rich repeat domain-containing protein [Planctomycetia bacterium]
MVIPRRPWLSLLSLFARGAAPSARRRGVRRREVFCAQFDGGQEAAFSRSSAILGCDTLERRIVLTASPAADFDFVAGTITGYHGAGGVVDIPARINGQAVVAIGDNAFEDNGEATWPLTRVVIPNSVITIGDGAFSGATYLASVTLGNQVQTIGDGAFFGDTSLKSITIPNCVRTIGVDAFAQCTSLTRFDVQPCNHFYSSDASGALLNKSGTVLISYPAGRSSPSYTIPRSVTTIADGAFAYARLTRITIPNRVTSLGSNAFAHAQSLASVTLGTGITSVPAGAFFDCPALRSFTIPGNVTTIGDYAFYADRGLTSVTIGDRVTSIGSNAFFACTSLASVTIPASVTDIGSVAFGNCGVLTSVTFKGNAPSVGILAFFNVGPDPKAYRAATLTGYGPDGSNFYGLTVATPAP